MPSALIPSFLLYGEDDDDTPPNFAHIETIASRSSLHDWEIAPHRHRQSVQALVALAGQVTYRNEQAVHVMAAPCFAVVPVGSVHGFQFSPDTTGHILSLSTGFAARAAEPVDRLLQLLTHGGQGTLPADVARRIDWLCGEMLATQADWRTPDPLFLALAEVLMRSLIGGEEDNSPLDSQRMARFRRLLELHLHEHRSVNWYAEHLGITAKTLSRTCRQCAGLSPIALIHSRLVLEAQRLLCFTNASIAQVADSLGFSDPSYFSRFYKRMTGDRPILVKKPAAAAGDLVDKG
ncbi:helix-turn-helix domain-containing protein [Novosphingobium flavum]|uniref:Helix-turn-helix domain-containing protein n=1 Tax=Novosphingobium flavum TaxID=1778672 RepID=A0A7X1KMB6_9SPHN|nr:helix-turn-helix domain-containing protein [Novosphingobium flavum]MBC2666449.1 helix-turn-helix domain-containing protein [Novosphingobium flavum]